MIFKTSMRLGNLHCVTPSDPAGEDEPYLWVFFITIDGRSIRQRTNDPAHVTANVEVRSGPGRPGNLHVTGIKGGANIHIKSDVGQSDTQLQPIVLNLMRDGAPVRVFIPGRVSLFCFAFDEDSTPRDVMETAFNRIKPEIGKQLNDFLNGIDLNAMAEAALAQPDPQAAFEAALMGQLATVIEQIRATATNIVVYEILASVASKNDFWHIFENFAELTDPDEPIGFARFDRNEQNILNSDLGDRFNAELRQQGEGLDGAWYVVHGSLDASVSFTPDDLVARALPEVSQDMSVSDYTFQRDHVAACVYAGSTIPITRRAHVETYDVSVEYPFLTYRYFVEGQELAGESGTFTLEKEVRIPEFDEDALTAGRPFVTFRRERRQVTVRFAKGRLPSDPQIEHLFLSNDPSDGTYDFLLQAEALFPSGRIAPVPVGSEPIFFDGQTIEFPPEFMRGVRDCMENFVGTKWAKSKRVTRKDLWGPVARRSRYEEVAKELDALTEVGAFERQHLETMKEVLAAALKIRRE